MCRIINPIFMPARVTVIHNPLVRQPMVVRANKQESCIFTHFQFEACSPMTAVIRHACFFVQQ